MTRLIRSYTNVVLVAGALWLSSQAHAVTTSWTNNSGGFFTVAANWDNGVPGDADTAIFRLGAAPTYTVTFPGNPIVQPPALYVNDQLRVGTGDVTFRSNFRAVYTLDNPTIAEAGRGIIIGELPGDNAVLNTFMPVNGSAATIGDAAGSNGALNVNAGTFTVTGDSGFGPPSLIVGNHGAGALNVAAGARVHLTGLNSILALGSKAGSTGAVSVSGAGALLNIGDPLDAGAIGVGSFGSGTLNISDGGQVTHTNNAFIGGASGMAIVDGAGSIWRGGFFNVGLRGMGTLNITNGGQVVAGEGAAGRFVIGDARLDGTGAVTGTGAVNVGGAGSSLVTGDLIRLDNGSLNITNEADVTSVGSASIGEQNSPEPSELPANGAVIVDGATWTIQERLRLGSDGVGTLTIRNGGQASSGETQIGISPKKSLVHVDGPGSRWTSASVRIGLERIGFFGRVPESASCA